MESKLKDPRQSARRRRQKHIRLRVVGSAERPRLNVFRSTKHMYAQLVDDETGTTLCATSTLAEGVKEDLKGTKKSQAAEKVGQRIAALAKEKGIGKVVFDRAGYPYHGRVAALAKGARDAGLSF